MATNYWGGGGGGQQHERGCQSEVLPPRKGGAQKRGGHNNFLGSFNTGAQSFGHNDWGAQKVSTLDGREREKFYIYPVPCDLSNLTNMSYQKYKYM